MKRINARLVLEHGDEIKRDSVFNHQIPMLFNLAIRCIYLPLSFS